MYKVTTTDERSQHQIEALPAEALPSFAEARAALELAPWSGKAYHRRRPDGPMRSLSYGPHDEGDILVVLWLA